MTTTTIAAPRINLDRLEWLAFATLLAFIAVIQISIALAQILLTGSVVLWAALLATGHERVQVPRVFWPLGLYAMATLVSALASGDPYASLADCKQLVLFAIVPVVWRLARGDRARLVVLTILTVGAVSALVGVVQYGVLQFDNLGRRPQGTLSHYMTYSGSLMLVACVAVARLIYHRHERAWPALIMPALLAALALTFTRSAWVGACAGVAVLFVQKDFRLVAVLPIVAAIVIAAAPSAITDRVYSMFDLNDPTNRDRVAMIRYGVRMIGDHPLTGVGPDRIKDVYADYIDTEGTHVVNPHLHNVPIQIAAERGLPAFGFWAWFIAGLAIELVRRFRGGTHVPLAAGALASLVAMLAAGLFEYNFGDSEFLMLWLVIVTLPFAASAAREATA